MNRSEAQITRQKHRDVDGKDYYSHHDTDGLINDELLCLCEKCMNKLDKYDGKTAIKIAFGRRSK